MKHFRNIILLLASGAVMLSLGACTGDQALPPLNMPEALGDATIGDGEWETPMSAYQASLGTIPHDIYGLDKTEAWVTGYIVGWVNVDISNSNIELGADFSVPATAATNIMIASRPDETNPAYVATVQLPSGAVRNALNLKDHPENLHTQVTLYGQVGSKYCGAYGVRSVSAYNWGDKGLEPDPAMTPPAGSRTVWTASLTTDMQGFTFDQGAPSTAGFEVWKHSTVYGLVATGGRAGSAVTCDAWAISPVIDLTDYVQPRLFVHQAANYFTNTVNFLEMTRTVVREVGGEWIEVDLPYSPIGNSWTFSDSGYGVIDGMAGKKIQIGFNYTSTTDMSGTWEIDKVTVTGVYNK
ncbi:MAG: choice-of-anchor J domain-containing protein [Muribaculaceae bacterium]|nr:choice-of-anchor J domain-containing protein [Muribaculaceae bacterium]